MTAITINPVSLKAVAAPKVRQLFKRLSDALDAFATYRMQHAVPAAGQRCAEHESFSVTDSATSIYLIGKNSRGHWVVRDQSGLRGGLFVNRAEALKFAMFENGHRPQAVVMTPGVLELDMSRKAAH
jgi:hypothetical protein